MQSIQSRGMSDKMLLFDELVGESGPDVTPNALLAELGSFVNKVLASLPELYGFLALGLLS